MMIALLIYWRARDMLPPNWANTIFAQRLEIWVRVRVRFPFLGGRGSKEMEVEVVVAVVTVGGDGDVSY